MSHSTPLSSPATREAHPLERARPRHRFRPLRLAILLFIVCVGALFEPDCYRFLTRIVVRCEAWRAGVSTHIGAVEGSLFDPVILRDTVWIYESNTGPVTRVEVQTATAEFAWRNLLPRSSGHVFQRLSLQGVTGKIQFPLTAAEAPPAARGFFHWSIPRPEGTWLPAPERIEARDVDFIFQSDHDYVRLAETAFTLSSLEAGTIRAGQIVLKQPWINRTFRDVRGTTAIQDAKVEVANLTLDTGVQVRSFSAELDDLARGRLNLEMQVAAFGGSIRVAAETLSEERPLNFEATGTFSQIGLAKLAAFLGFTDAAGGTIKEGKFTFRGPPQQLARATASLRFEATNFQWDSRQWDSLVLGATLMNGRVQVPELALAQGHNRLNLSGEMPLPLAGVEWWQTDFDLNIAAKIDNLTELSALMLPEFQYAAGKANIDGSVRGKDQQFHGQLIVSGSELRWHNAPVEELHAAVKLNGNEFQITSVSVFNQGDYLRGHGVVNILGDKQYWGEFHAAIEDLAMYSAILQKPIVPEPLAGGAVLDWSGEGSAKGHSGKFSARVRKLRSLGATAALLHPINGDFEGSYSPGAALFERFMLSDDNSSFTANVGIGNKALSLQGIRLLHNQALWLQGDALLPLDVWNAWPNTTLATLLDDQTVGKVNLTADHLDLHEASLLTGWIFPIQGVVSGNLVAEGPLGGLKTSGKFSLSKAQIPLGWSGHLLTAVEGEASLDGQTLQVAKLSGRHEMGDFSATGLVDFTKFRDPTLKFEVATGKSQLEIFPRQQADPAHPNFFAEIRESSSATVAAKLQVAGPATGATVAGEAQVSDLYLSAEVSGLAFALGLDDRPPSIPNLFAFTESPWNAWKMDLVIHSTPEAVVFQQSLPAQKVGGRLALNLRLTGSGNDLALTGDAIFREMPVWARTAGLQLNDATITFREGFTHDPSISAEASGEALAEKFKVEVDGTFQHPMRFFVFDPPLTERIIRVELRGGTLASRLGEEAPPLLPVPAPFFEGTDVVEWTAIPTPPPEPANPAPASSAAPAAPPAPTPANTVPAPIAPPTPPAPKP